MQFSHQVAVYTSCMMGAYGYVRGCGAGIFVIESMKRGCTIGSALVDAI